MKVTVAVLDKHGDNAVSGMLDLLRSFDFGQVSHFGLVLPQKSFSEKPLGILNRQGLDSSTLIGYVSSKPTASSGYDFLQLDDAGLIFEGKVYKPVPKAALTEKVAKEPLHCEASLQTLIEQADGDYHFLMVKNGWIAAGRDPIGVQPLYYGENRDIAAFATNRKALWQLGIDKPVSFPPGNMGFADKNGFKFKTVKAFTYAEPKVVSMDEAAKTVQTLLEQAVKTRLAGLNKVAIAFSGGLDSSIIAYMASKLGVKVELIHVSLENQPETEAAWEASDKLGLPMQVHLFKESDVETTLPQVVDLIEEADPVKASIGVPFYWTAQKTVEEGYNVLLAGQGADELFGGYQRYVNECCAEGSEKARQTMFNDVLRIHESNLERDEKICINFDVELRLPFAAFDLVEYALGLPVDLKFESKVDSLRKLVLRRVALNLGLSASIVDKPKKAVQYSTGINDAVKRIAKRREQSVNEYIAELFAKSYEHYFQQT